MRELAIEQTCLLWLNQQGWYAWKNPTVGVWDEQAKAYRKPGRFQITGAADAIAIRDGQVVFIEFKTETGAQSNAQVLFEKQLRKHKIPYILARSLEGLQHELKAAGLIP